MKKRKELQEEGVPLEKLKFCNFKVFNDGKKVEIDGNAPPKKQSSLLECFRTIPFDEEVANTEKVIGSQTYKLQAEQNSQPRNLSCQIMRRR